MLGKLGMFVWECSGCWKKMWHGPFTGLDWRITSLTSMKIIKRTKTGWYQRLVGGWTPKRKQIDIGEFMSLVIPFESKRLVSRSMGLRFWPPTPARNAKTCGPGTVFLLSNFGLCLGTQSSGPWHQKWEKSKIGFSSWICWDAFRLMTVEFGFLMISLLLCDGGTQKK